MRPFAVFNDADERDVIFIDIDSLVVRTWENLIVSPDFALATAACMDWPSFALNRTDCQTAKSDAVNHSPLKHSPLKMVFLIIILTSMSGYSFHCAARS